MIENFRIIINESRRYKTKHYPQQNLASSIVYSISLKSMPYTSLRQLSPKTMCLTVVSLYILPLFLEILKIQVVT